MYQVAPYEIWRMERSEFSNSSTISSAGSVQDLSQKIAQSDESSSNHQETVNQCLTQKRSDFSFYCHSRRYLCIHMTYKIHVYVQGLVNLYSVGESCNVNVLESSSFFLPKAAIGFITSLASSLFGSHGSTSAISSHSLCNDTEDQSDSEILVQEATEPHTISESKSDEVDMDTMVNLPIVGKGINKTLDSTIVSFKQFDMVTDCSDHHFFSPGKELAQSPVRLFETKHFNILRSAK